MIDLLGLSRRELADLLRSWGYSAFHAEQLWRGLYRELLPLADVSVREDLAERLASEATVTRLATSRSVRSADGDTEKLLLSLADGEAVESVLMRIQSRERDDEAQFKDTARSKDTVRYTACVSTQVGCAIRCVFCATGQMGFRRHLTAAEIVAQIRLLATKLADRGDRLRNVVFMGMGEPLHNYDNTMRALDIVTSQLGLAIAPSQISLSTIGLPREIRRLADEGRPYRLAVSLHGATDADRLALVPTAARWPLSELIAACRHYSEVRKQKMFFAWTLIDGKNDTPEQAHALGRLLAGVRAHVNLIPLNPTQGYAGRPSGAVRIEGFRAILSTYGLPSTLRQRRGIDIDAGCGQLAAR